MLEKENKQEICNKLCVALQATRNAYDLMELVYHGDTEIVDIVFLAGTKHVCVAMDSGTAMIRDIVNNLGC